MEITSWLVRIRPPARAPNAAAAAIVMAPSPSVHSRTFLIVSIASHSSSGVSVGFTVQAYLNHVLRRYKVVVDPVSIHRGQRSADEWGRWHRSRKASHTPVNQRARNPTRL